MPFLGQLMFNRSRLTLFAHPCSVGADFRGEEQSNDIRVENHRIPSSVAGAREWLLGVSTKFTIERRAAEFNGLSGGSDGDG